MICIKPCVENTFDFLYSIKINVHGRRTLRIHTVPSLDNSTHTRNCNTQEASEIRKLYPILIYNNAITK